MIRPYRACYDRAVTVAAVVLAAPSESPLADADGLPRVRRIADAAWAGGAIPIIVVAADPDGAISSALAGAQASLAGGHAALARPGPADTGPAGQLVRGIAAALSLVRDTEAVLVWPAGFPWVGPETVTSLLEAHGVTPGALLRPTYRGAAGWPVLLPLAHLELLRSLGPDRGADEVVGALIAADSPHRTLDLGDPGTVIGGQTARRALPPYDGPPEPVAGHVHEWGAAVADRPDEPPEPPAVVG